MEETLNSLYNDPIFDIRCEREPHDDDLCAIHPATSHDDALKAAGAIHIEQVDGTMISSALIAKHRLLCQALITGDN